ncbi:MAG: preprotein translocase subunit YajC [Flavobacteriales bacterium]|jgi:preprotein translocase subunit YajC|nr:preprotein translocase subunit YajC [Flavobacteriales bacterium]|tara:strand:+ start:322 stop:633 length:312 start_codon:yes stop_codon:yes gene_type:complete
MNTLIVLLQTTPSGGFASFLPIILIIFVFYFFMIRPQINKQKNEDSFRSQLKKGDKVVTIGGIHGKISVLKETKVILEIANDLKITIDKQSISRDKSLIEEKS